MSCEPPFWKDITILFSDFSLQYSPTCQHSPYNFVARLLLISLFVGMLASVLGGLSAFLVTLLFGTITAIAIILTTNTNTNTNTSSNERKELRT